MLMFLGGRPNLAPPGRYRLVLTADGVELTQWLRLEVDPTQAASSTAAEDGPP